MMMMTMVIRFISTYYRYGHLLALIICMAYLYIYITYFPPFLIDNIVISPSPTASNLGILFYSTLSYIPHITSITKSAN